MLPSPLAGRRPRPPADLTDSEEDEESPAPAVVAAAAAPRRPPFKMPRRGAAAQHPGMMPPPSTGAVCSGGPAPSVTCSADSTCTAGGGSADGESCGAFPRPRLSSPPPPPAAAAAAPAKRPQQQVPAATAPPELCRDDDGCGECMGPPHAKRARRGFSGSAAALAMRRTRSVPRSMSDLLQEGADEAGGPAGAGAPAALAGADGAAF